MGSKGRMPPPPARSFRRPLSDHFGGPDMRAPPHDRAFPPPLDRMPPPHPHPHQEQVMEQKLAMQHLELQRLATENQKLASTHGTLRHELATAQHELQMIQTQIGAAKNEREQQMRNLMDKIDKMEGELKNGETVKLELKQATENAQNLVTARQELINKVHQLHQDLQRAHVDVQQIPALMSELDSLRQEYQHCRATYDYEKKLYNDHLESLQVMEKNYMAMAGEVEKLRAELTSSANVDRRIGGPYETPGNHIVGQNTYEDGHGVPQGRGPLPVATAGAPVPHVPTYAGGQPGPPPPMSGYEPLRAPGGGYDPQRVPNYDPQRVPNYDPQRGPSGYDAQKIPNYEALRGQGAQWGQGGFEAQRGGPSGPHGQPVAHSNHVPYGTAAQPAHPNHVPFGTATPPAHAGSAGYEAQTRSANPVRR